MKFEVEQSKRIPTFQDIAKDPEIQEMLHRPTRVDTATQKLIERCPDFEYVRRFGVLPPKHEIAPISLAEVEEPRASRWNSGWIGKITSLIV